MYSLRLLSLDWYLDDESQNNYNSFIHNWNLVRLKATAQWRLTVKNGTVHYLKHTCEFPQLHKRITIRGLKK